jgi:mannose/fructose/N-acetylgalactosamine-specific phosphotransferase system component IIB
VLEQRLPLDAGITPETLRAHTLQVGEAVRDVAAPEPATTAAAITLSMASTFIRSCDAGHRHLEIRLGNVETPDGARQIFAAVASTDTAIETLRQRGLTA